MRLELRAAAIGVLVLFAPGAAAAEPALKLDLGGGVSIELVLVKAASFKQGSPPSEAGRADDETLRDVTITRDFYIGKYEVTRRQWNRFVEETRYKTEAERGTSGGFGWDGKALTQAARFNWRDPGFANGDDHPVTIVTYDDALAFTIWLTKRARRAVTLPTEAEWEYAARAGSRGRFYSGDALAAASEIGWMKTNAANATHAVGQKKPNGFGLYDMAGNVAEWCLDWYAPYAPGAVTDPLETRSTYGDKPRRVLRGGSWLKDGAGFRSAARARSTPGSRNADIGFRVAASVETAAAALPPASAPLAARASAGAPPPTTPRPAAAASQGGGFSLAISAILLLLFFAVVAAIVAGFRMVGGASRGPRTTVASDGFTMYVPKAKVGDRVRYSYSVDGVAHTDETTVTGDPAQGVFVYTGSRPSAVQVLSVAGVAAAAAVMASRSSGRRGYDNTTPTRSVLDDDYDDDRASSFRGYPSAY